MTQSYLRYIVRYILIDRRIHMFEHFGEAHERTRARRVPAPRSPRMVGRSRRTLERDLSGDLAGAERFFDNGHLRLVILQLIADKPSYGYEIMKAIEERLSGGYAPSPGRGLSHADAAGRRGICHGDVGGGKQEALCGDRPGKRVSEGKSRHSESDFRTDAGSGQEPLAAGVRRRSSERS